MTTPMNPIDHLANLAQQRTVRTDRLHNTVINLFARLRELVPVGTSVTVNDVCVSLGKTRSNVGEDVSWSALVGRGDGAVHCSDIERPVNYHGYLHGDFNCFVTGPSRAILIAVGKATPEIVQALIDATDKLNTNLAVAQASVDTAAAILNPES